MKWSIVACCIISISSTASGGKNFTEWAFLKHANPFVPTAKEGSACYVHSQRFVQDLADYKLWALKMHDSSGKLPSGLLNGNVHAFGDFWQCLGIKEDLEDKLGTVNGKYCLVNAFFEVEKSEAVNKRVANAFDLMLSHRAIQSSYNDDVSFFPTFSPISWGFCVPDSCSHEDIKKTVEAALQPFNTTSGISIRVKSDENFCQVQRPLRGYFKGTALPVSLFFAVMSSIALLGAFLEYAYPRDENAMPNSFCYELITAFSFKRNWKSLIDTRSLPEDVGCVHGIRFICSMAIYIIHRSVFGLFAPFTNRTEMAEELEGEWSMLFRCFWNVVDSFVVLSGFLTSYFCVIKLQQGKKINILIMYLKRYYKFTPMYLATLWIVRNLAVEFRNGPNHLRVVKHFIRTCQDNMWKSMLYIGNIDGLDKMCYPPSHQLITDMQMYLVAPWVVLLLWKFAKKGLFAILATIAVLTVNKGWMIYRDGLGTFIYYGAKLSDMVPSADQMYLNPLHRLTPYLCGVLLGYFIRTRAQHFKITEERLNFGWCSATLAAYYCFFGPKHAAHRDYEFDARESAIYGMAQPILWSCALSWVIFVCHAGKGGMLNTLLSWKGFVVFTRLSYAFYLTQILVIFNSIGGANTPIFTRLLDIIDLNEAACVVFLSILFTLLLLLPLAEVFKVFYFRNSTNRTNELKNIELTKKRSSLHSLHELSSTVILPCIS